MGPPPFVTCFVSSDDEAVVSPWFTILIMRSNFGSAFLLIACCNCSHCRGFTLDRDSDYSVAFHLHRTMQFLVYEYFVLVTDYPPSRPSISIYRKSFPCNLE